MPDLFSPSMILAVEREIKMRVAVYPRRVAAKKMTQKQADREIAAMRSVLNTLRQFRAGMVRPAHLED